MKPGVAPLISLAVLLAKLGHGHDERLPVSFIETGLPVLWEVVQEFCA